MSREQMIAAIRTVYPGDNFAIKLASMPDKQIHSMYMRLMNAGKLKG